jgi:hypothetical protein
MIEITLQIEVADVIPSRLHDLQSILAHVLSEDLPTPLTCPPNL